MAPVPYRGMCEAYRSNLLTPKRSTKKKQTKAEHNQNPAVGTDEQRQCYLRASTVQMVEERQPRAPPYSPLEEAPYESFCDFFPRMISSESPFSPHPLSRWK